MFLLKRPTDSTSCLLSILNDPKYTFTKSKYVYGVVIKYRDCGFTVPSPTRTADPQRLMHKYSVRNSALYFQMLPTHISRNVYVVLKNLTNTVIRHLYSL